MFKLSINMKNLYLLLLIATMHSQFSCNNVEKKENSTKDKTVNSPPLLVLSKMRKFISKIQGLKKI